MNASCELTPPKAVLFDLDGTLIDSAPDLATAINQIRIDKGLAPAPYETLRCAASAGAPGLLKAAFGMDTSHPDYPELADTFVANYTRAIAVKSTLFDGIEALLERLRVKNIPWGIVTNKRHVLTLLLLEEIGLSGAACVISGDTTPHPKPHPEPLREAARRMGVAPQACWFVGDDLRDIQAGRAAESLTIAVNWGYGTDTVSWNADLVVDTPGQIADLIR
jgi:phosphoglycolate phosphatase